MHLFKFSNIVVLMCCTHAGQCQNKCAPTAGDHFVLNLLNLNLKFKSYVAQKPCVDIAKGPEVKDPQDLSDAPHGLLCQDDKRPLPHYPSDPDSHGLSFDYWYLHELLHSQAFTPFVFATCMQRSFYTAKILYNDAFGRTGINQTHHGSWEHKPSSA